MGMLVMNFHDEPVNRVTIIIQNYYCKFNEGLPTTKRLSPILPISYRKSPIYYYDRLPRFRYKYFKEKREVGIILMHPMSPNPYSNAKITPRILTARDLFLISPTSAESTHKKQDNLSVSRFYLGKSYPDDIVIHKKFIYTTKKPDAVNGSVADLVKNRYKTIKILFTTLTYDKSNINYEDRFVQSFYIEYKSARSSVHFTKSISEYAFTKFLVEGADLYIILSKIDANHSFRFTKTISFDRVNKKVSVVLRASFYCITYFQDASDKHTDIQRLLFYRFENKNNDIVYIKVDNSYSNTKSFNIILPLDKVQVYNLHRDIYELHMSDVQRLVDKLIMDGAVVKSQGELGLCVILK